MSRGKLINPFLAELYLLDSRATGETAPGVLGPLTGGYDPDFKEPVRVDRDDDGIGESARREHSALRVPCQVEPAVFDRLRMFATGASPEARIDLVFHYQDLERLGLVDRIHNGDRLGAIFTTAGELVLLAPDLFVTEVRPAGFGLGGRRNLLLVTFERRAAAPPRSIG